MNIKRKATSMALILLAVSLVSTTAIQNEVFAAVDQGMSMTAMAPGGSDTISIMGETASLFTDITLMVIAPNGNMVSVDQITPAADGKFTTDIKIGSLWSEDGYYIVTAKQGANDRPLYTIELRVEVINGIVSETSTSDSTLERESDYVTYQTTNEAERSSGLSITADAVEGSTIIGISGTTNKLSTDITLTVKAPNGNVVTVKQVSPGLNGNFESAITTGGPLWQQDGIYTVTAKQGSADSKYTDSVEVEIIDGVVIPEFGTIAALVLAVAIISIIAVSARSRLSIMPRY